MSQFYFILWLKVPVVVPAWVDLGHAAAVSEGATPAGADADEEDDHGGVDHGDLVPVLVNEKNSALQKYSAGLKICY